MGKHLGQHFLVNRRKLGQIVGAAELKNGDFVIEIGPGHGELTELIARNFQFPVSNFQLVLIEKDKNFVEILKKKFSQDKNIEVIEGDALKVLPKLTKSYKLKTKNYKLIGNIPYYITGYLFRIIGELENKPELIVFVIQKEVAQRICALPPKMNLLAASVQFWAEPKIAGYIPKKNFRPEPKVDSAIIRLTTNDQRPTTQENENYYKFIKILFKQPRKTIANNLRSMTNDQRLLVKKFQAASINPTDRPQNLNIEQILKLSQIFS